MKPGFGERLREYLVQAGMTSILTDDQLTSMDAALPAIKDKMDAFDQPVIGDAPDQICRDWLDRLYMPPDGCPPCSLITSHPSGSRGK
jgi:hypothetical protein